MDPRGNIYDTEKMRDRLRDREDQNAVKELTEADERRLDEFLENSDVDEIEENIRSRLDEVGE